MDADCKETRREGHQIIAIVFAVSYAMVDINCILAALLFIVGSAIELAFFHLYRNREHFNFSDFTNLDPAYLQTEWEFLREHSSLELASGITNALAWFVFAIPIIKVAWIQSCGGSRQLGVHVSIAAFAVGGSICELLSRLLYIGSMDAMEWLSTDFNLANWTSVDSNDQIGWRTLGMIQIAVSGLMLWIDAVEWLFLTGIFMLLFASVRNDSKGDRVFAMRWAYFGLFLAMLGIVEFAASLLRFQSWRTFSTIASGIGGLNRLFLFPIWLVWLGRQLPKAEAMVTMRLNESQSKCGRRDDNQNITESSETLTYS